MRGVGQNGRLCGKHCGCRQRYFEVVAGVDKINNGEKFPVFSSFGDINVKADMIIDFSHPSMLEPMLEYAVKNNIPVVIATTGYDNSQTEKIRAAAEKKYRYFLHLICRSA